MTNVPKLCSRCKAEPRANGRSWCRKCNARNTRRWLDADPVRAAANMLIRGNNTRARRHGAVGSIGSYEWMALVAKYGNACAACGRVTRLTIDHIKPLSHGGTNTIDNVQPLCMRCNVLKGICEIDFRKDV